MIGTCCCFPDLTVSARRPSLQIVLITYNHVNVALLKAKTQYKVRQRVAHCVAMEWKPSI